MAICCASSNWLSTTKRFYATELDYSKYPKIDYTSFTDNVTKNVTASEETYVSRTGDVQSYINVAWDIVEASNNNYSVLITDITLGTTQHYNVNSCYYRYGNAVVGHAYEIEVRAIVDGITVGGGKTSVYISWAKTLHRLTCLFLVEPS